MKEKRKKEEEEEKRGGEKKKSLVKISFSRGNKKQKNPQSGGKV